MKFKLEETLDSFIRGTRNYELNCEHVASSITVIAMSKYFFIKLFFSHFVCNSQLFISTHTKFVARVIFFVCSED